MTLWLAARALHRLLEWKQHGVRWPARSGLKTDLLTTIIKRINEASGIYQMFSVLGDVILLRRYDPLAQPVWSTPYMKQLFSGLLSLHFSWS